MTEAPLIGITTSLEQDEQRISTAYVDAILRAGGIPVLLPMTADTDAARVLLHRIRGLMIVGGPAVTIGLIGDLPDDLEPAPPVRLQSDVTYLEGALALGLPILGICYGMQLMNALAEGTIYADVHHQIEGTLVHSASRGGMPHELMIASGTLLERLLKVPRIEVNTRHIQAIAVPGHGYEVSGRATDGVIEAIESSDGLRLGVQFHAERLLETTLPLFQHLVQLAGTLR